MHLSMSITKATHHDRFPPKHLGNTAWTLRSSTLGRLPKTAPWKRKRKRSGDGDGNNADGNNTDGRRKRKTEAEDGSGRRKRKAETIADGSGTPPPTRAPQHSHKKRPSHTHTPHSPSPFLAILASFCAVPFSVCFLRGLFSPVLVLTTSTGLLYMDPLLSLAVISECRSVCAAGWICRVQELAAVRHASQGVCAVRHLCVSVGAGTGGTACWCVLVLVGLWVLVRVLLQHDSFSRGAAMARLPVTGTCTCKPCIPWGALLHSYVIVRLRDYTGMCLMRLCVCDYVAMRCDACW